MTIRTAAIPMVLLFAASCSGEGEPPPSQGATTPAYERVENDSSSLDQAETPVRIGELGPNFPACYAVGRFRDRVVGEGEAIPARAAPFDQARETGRIPAGGRFFICNRSHDQRWFAVIWDESEGAGRRCGVSLPIPQRRDYEGPCRSGWVPSALVLLESGMRDEEPQGNASS
ncbi:MAG: hypothetical protein M3N07_07380 [Pseudomonadota bacterium]|nr:hypothetical protein [Pseudomonadota bacterium]